MDYITEVVSVQGIVPSIREMCANIGVTSTSTVNYYLNILEERGYIKRSFNKIVQSNSRINQDKPHPTKHEICWAYWKSCCWNSYFCGRKQS